MYMCGPDQSDQLNMLDSDDGSVSLQDTLKWVIASKFKEEEYERK